jgi:hypothetical protein
MRVQWKDGKEFAGRTSEEVVRSIIDSSTWTVGMDTEPYMQAVAARVERLKRGPIRHEDAVEFLLDLEWRGFITVTEKEDES